MNKMRIGSVLLFCVPCFIAAAAAPAFTDYFQEKALRIDLYQIGDAKTEAFTLHRVTVEPAWTESRRLIDPFGYGRYMIQVFAKGTDTLIYSRGFDCIFGEYRTTDPALKGVKRTYSRSLRIPCPHKPVRFSLLGRDRQNNLHQIFESVIDPADYHLQTEDSASGTVIDILSNGDPREKVDLLFVAEGYTVEDAAKFKGDAERFAAALFGIEPFQSCKQSFNIRALFHASAERGPDEPRQGKYHHTLLDASFNAFDLDRYMLTESGHKLRQLASQAPYDALAILVNSTRYGGGGIYNDYCISTVDHERSQAVFLHEFGHSFGGLADEYYTSDVAYNEFYPKGVEPSEPNITALLDPARVKWADLLSPGITIPTEYGKTTREALQAERRQAGKSKDEQLKSARSEAEKKKIEARYQKLDRSLTQKIEALTARYRHLEDKVGVFEGAGYASKGLFRPMIHCLMISHPKNQFCRVCQRAIAAMIDYYTGS